MKTKLMMVTLGALMCAGALWYANEARRSIAGAKESLAALARKRAEILDRADHAGRRVRAAEEKIAQTQAAAAKPENKSPMATLPATGRPASPRELMMNDPKLQALWLTATQARLRRNFGPFYAMLHLTPEQIGKFQAALMKREEAFMDLSAIAQSQGPDTQSAVATLRKQAEDECSTTLRDVMGEDGLRQLKDYDQTADIRLFVARIGSTAAIDGAALTDTQVTQLARAMADASGQLASGGKISVAKLNWQPVDAAAQQILTPAQFEVFEQSRMEYNLDAAIAKGKEQDSVTQ